MHPAVQGHNESTFFEKSGEFLSSSHSAIEEVMSGHLDISHSLQDRVEVRSHGQTIDQIRMWAS